MDGFSGGGRRLVIGCVRRPPLLTGSREIDFFVCFAIFPKVNDI